MSREAFLDRVRRAAQAGQAHRVQLHPLPPDVGYVGVEGDLCERFAAEIEAIGGVVHAVDDRNLARSVLDSLVAAGGASRALCWQHELLVRLGLDELLAARGIQRLDYAALAALPPAQRREVMLACQIGITSCDWAIAETGSLVMCSGAGRERVASLLPPMHVAVVERKQIVPDLVDAIGALSRGGHQRLPSNVVLISGPSKTGDIELQLTTGVHGPGTWHVIVIKQ
ncbi:MAG TPA: lactate utilization protein [Pirellulaceae bacterium]|nr:lactate utilization protein [Pirellulaceae bacterium]